MRRVAGLLLLAVLAVLPACGGGSSERVVIYSGRTENLVGPLLERFAEETGIDVDVRYGDSADLALLIDQEGERSPADVFLSQSPGAIGFLATSGALAPLPETVLSKVDREYRSAKGLWVGVSGRVRVLVYNTELLEEADLPDSVLDLTAAEWRGKVALAPTNGSFQDFVTGLRLSVGDDAALGWLRAMRENGSPTYANNTAIVQAVARGEVPAGLVNHYYNFRQKAEEPGSPTENHAFPSGDIGSLLIATGIGVLDGAAHPEPAARLVEFLLSAGAQRFFADETFEYPLAAGVEPADGVPAAASLGAHRIELDRFGDSLEQTKRLIEQSGLERS